MNKVPFPSHQPGFSFPFLSSDGTDFPTVLTAWLPVSSQAPGYRCLRSVVGFPLGVELRDGECKCHSTNRGVFCSMEKVVEETRGQRGPHHHEYHGM